MNDDTIVAVATAEGPAGLAVIRLSGPDALAVAGRVFQSRDFGDDPEDRRAVYGILKWPNAGIPAGISPNTPIDEILALPLRAPRSYTGEDTVEFFCHGGRAVVGSALAACRAAGARPAAAGEFTRRAFLNGRLSLDRAEAVADLIHAESELAARAAVRQLLGGLDEQLAAVERPLLELLGRIEGSLEFADQEDVAVDRAEVAARLGAAVAAIDRLAALAPAGRLLRDGVQVVLAGAPNVGKSSLFNALLGEDRAIVDDRAGTTRDVVSAAVQRGGTRFVFHDTAGLRRGGDRVERLGMDRTWKSVAEADIVLLLAEAGGPAAAELDGAAAARVIRVLTKADAAAASGDLPATSSRTGEGLPELWAALEAAVADFGVSEAVAMGVVLNERHLHRLQQCRAELAALLAELAAPTCGDEVLGTLLAGILARLGEVSGRVFSEALLEAVFRRFCVGK